MITVGDAEMEQRRIRAALDAGVSDPQVLTWHYASPAVVLGRGQRPTAEVLERAEGEHLAVVTRSSGGGAVVTGPWMLSFTLLLPAVHPLAKASLPVGYRAVGEACRGVLNRFRLPTEIAGHTAATGADGALRANELGWACFADVSHGELVAVGGRKVVGLSQVRRRDAIAVCIGVLLSRPNWEVLLRVWQGWVDPKLVQQFEDRTATCVQLASPNEGPSPVQLAAALEAELPVLDIAA